MKQTKLLRLLGLTLLIAFAGCNKDEIPEISETINSGPRLKSGGDGVWDVLGFGYDLAGTYLHPESVKNAVINVVRLATDYPDKVYYNASTYGYNSYTYGYNSEDYLTEKSKEVLVSAAVSYAPLVGKRLFSGSFSSSSTFSTKLQYNSAYMFANCDAVKNVKRIYLTADMSLLMNYLNPSFVQDLNTKSADEVVDIYGTSVLTDFTIGGRISFIYRSVDVNQMTSDVRKSTVKAGLNASLVILNISRDANVTQQTIDTYKGNNKTRTLYIEYFGGEGTGASYNLETGYPTVSISTWETSVNKYNAALTKVDWTKAIPIWEFTTDPVKKSLLKAAVVKHVDDSQIKLIGLTPIIGQIFQSGTVNYYIPLASSAASTLKTLVNKTENSLISLPDNIHGFLFTNQEANTQPLYLYIKNFTYKRGTQKFLYTNSNSISDPSYKYICLMGYVYYSQIEGFLRPNLPGGYNYSSYLEGQPYYVYVP
jgi:hypothetical protein